MKVKPLKIKIKEPTPSAADRLYAKHQAIRKQRGLPDPSEYKKKLDSMKNEEVEQLDELSPATKASYKAKAQQQVKETQPWTKKGEYKDLAKNIIAKRKRGIAKVSEEVEKLDEMFPTTVLPHPQKNKLDPKKQKSVDRDIKLLSKYKEKKLSVSGALDRLANFKKKHKVSEEAELDEGLKKAIGAVATAAAMATSPHAHSAFVASPNIAVQQDIMKRDHERRAQQAKEKEGHEASRKAGKAAPLSDKSKSLLNKEEAELDEQLYKKARFVSGPSKRPFKSNTVVSPQNEDKDPCWKGYEMVGMKDKGGRKVPNCVPVKEDTGEAIESHTTLSRKAQIVKDAAKGKKDRQNAKDEASDKFQSEPELSSAIHKT